MAPSVAPPTPQEIQRKLSVHSAARTKPSTTSTLGGPSPSNITTAPVSGISGISTSWGTGGGGGGLISGTESDSDSILTPDVASAHVGFNPTSASLMQPPLSSIAERSPASGGEDSDEEDDDGAGWRVVTEGARPTGAGGHPRGADVVLKSGYLSKKGARRKTWKKRWFVLRPTHLAFYKNEAEYKLLRLLDLNDVHSCIPVQLKRHSNAFGLILPKRTYYLQAGSAQDVQNWVEAIEDARQTLMATSTQNSGNNASLPIPIPHPSNTGASFATRPPPISISPNQNPSAGLQLVSSSDSEDALSQLAPPPPPGGGGNGGGDRGGGGLVAPSPTNVTFSVSPTNKPIPTPVSPAPKESAKTILSGYLMKCGSKRRNWRKRWFVLTSEKLFYSRSHMDTKPHRVFSFSDILDAMDYDLPTGRSHHYHYGHNTHHHHATSALTPSLSTSSPQQHPISSSLGATSIISAQSVGATSTPITTTTTANSPPTSIGGGVVGGDLSVETEQQRNFTFKIVMTKRNLLLCAPSEEDEIKWLGAVRALIARRSGSGVLPGHSQQQQASSAVAAGAGVQGESGAGAAGAGIKSKVRRLSGGGGVLGGGGKSSTTASAAGAGGTGTGAAPGAATGAGVGDESREAH